MSFWYNFSEDLEDGPTSSASVIFSFAIDHWRVTLSNNSDIWIELECPSYPVEVR